MYHVTRKKQQKDKMCARMRAGKAVIRLRNSVPRNPPWEPPERRRVIIVIDFDFGIKVDLFWLFRSDRIDSYNVEHNGKRLGGRIGWANFCKRLSAHFPRVMGNKAQSQQ